MAFGIEAINLTSVDPETGLNNTAAVYTVEGISRQLSIGELVMVICLARAVKMEEDVTAIMSSMNETTHRLEQISTIEDAVMQKRSDSAVTKIGLTFEAIGLSKSDFPKTKEWSGGSEDNWDDWLQYEAGVEGADCSGTEITKDQADAVITKMETKMDELNTFSQQSMIQLQSATNKRDQAYDLCSAILKSFNTVLIGSANNL